MNEDFEKYVMTYIQLISTFASVSKEGNVLINCYAGINRSVLLICLILCLKYDNDPQDARKLMCTINRRRLKEALTNYSFNYMLIYVHSLHQSNLMEA